LHAVRFSIETLDALNTISPFDPEGRVVAAVRAYPLEVGVPELARPKFWAEVLLLQTEEPGLVPSTITLLRLIPRMWRFGVVMTTPAGNL
jgi:hypothetical protein